MSIYRDSPTCPRNLVNFGPETAQNGWRLIAHPLHFRIGRHCQPYRMDDNRQQINFDTCYVILCSDTSLQFRTTECRAGSRWALPCIIVFCLFLGLLDDTQNASKYFHEIWELKESRWRSGTTGRALDLRSSGSGCKSYSGQKLRNNLWQVVHTYVPLSPSSITWYRPRGGDALRLGR